MGRAPNLLPVGVALVSVALAWARPQVVFAPERAAAVDDAATKDTGPEHSGPRDDGGYADSIRPILERSCVGCHGPDLQKGGLRLDTLDPDFAGGPDAEEWSLVRDVVRAGDMPPRRAEPLPDDDRRALVGWLDDSLEAAARAGASEIPTVVRRLNRRQYTRTLQELFGLDVDFARVLPSDPKSKAGFTNDGEALNASLLHLETFESIARRAVGEALAAGPKPEATRYRVRFGEGIGVGHVAARTGGYQAVELDTADFVIDVLDADGRAIEPESKDERARLDALRRHISVGLRGSGQNRFRVTDDGLVLYGAVPHREKAPGAWQGPSPNAKLELQRVFPEAGRVAMRVTASRGRVWRTRDPVLVALEGEAPRVTLDHGTGELGTATGAIVATALSSDERDNVQNEGDALVPSDATMPSRARVRIDVPREGFWQVDLVHPTVAPERMPSIRLGHHNLTLDLRPVLDAEALARDRAVTTVGAAYLHAGGQHLTVGGPFFTGFSHVVLTPLPAEHPLVAELEARAADLEAAASDDMPVLRVYAGTRTDDGMDYATFDEPALVDAPYGSPATYEFHARLENLPVPEPESGDTEILSGFLLLGLWNDHLVIDRRSTGPPLLVTAIEIEAPYNAVWPPPARTAFFDVGVDRSDEDAYAAAVIERFLARAFRRPVEPETTAAYVGFWRDVRQEFDTLEESLAEVAVAALCSPHFLYLPEPEVIELGRIDDWALASRLSYFLWNGPPDERLLGLAARGELGAGRVREAERMLADPRSAHFVEAFSEEWLRLDRLDLMTVDADVFPKFTRFVKRDMRTETIAFVAEALRANEPIDAFVDADWSMLNGPLAEYYGIEGVRGPAFRRVEVPRERGGLLAHGAFLVGHSNGVDPHPIKRAVWLKEKILGQAPPPPPPNVPNLDPTAPGFQNLTLKEQLEKHRDSASCRDCHAGIDPFGIAFEKYGAAGLVETARKGRAIDASTTLPDGSAVDGVAALKAHLLGKERDAVVHAFAEHLFGYALGRRVGFADEPALEGIVEAARANGLGVRDVLLAIVDSPSFLR